MPEYEVCFRLLGTWHITADDEEDAYSKSDRELRAQHWGFPLDVEVTDVEEK